MGLQPHSENLVFRARLFVRGLAIACLAAMTAGCGLFADDWLDNVVEASSSSRAMWYRVQFEADYGEERVKIDQMVTCTIAVISGGFFGQSPSSRVTEAYPKTAGVDLADGSRVVVRLPDMCNRNRAVKVVDGIGEKQRGWEETGSFDVMPLVIWSERSSDPERVESYISRDYYNHPEARFTNAKGTLTLWEVGRVPDNVHEILSEPPFEPFTPNPWIKPERQGKLSIGDHVKGYGRSGGYHGKGPRYAAYTITEIDSVEEWYVKFQEYAEKRVGGIKDRLGPPEPDPRLETDQVSIWRSVDIMSRRVGDPDFIYADCPENYIRDLMLGVPRMSDLAFNSQDGKSIITGIAIKEDGPYQPDYEKPDMRLRAMQWRACSKRAAQTRTFDIIDGRLDASKAIPGVLVYRKWGLNLHEGGKIFRTPALVDAGVQVGERPSKWRHKIGEVQFGITSYGNPAKPVQIKSDDSWFLVNDFDHFYEGRRENSRF